MVLTAANVGDVIRLDQKARCILIENVTDKFVHYRQETGERYATYEREISGSIVQDPKVVSEFHRNAKIGETLNHAEFSVFRKLMDRSLEPFQRDEAVSVLGIIKGMQKHLEERVAGRQAEHSSARHASLEDMIRKANIDRQNPGSQDIMRKHGKDHSAGR